MNINFREALSPAPGYEFWDYMAYAILFISLLAIIFASEDTSTMITLFFGIIFIGAAADKLYILGYLFEPETSSREMRIQRHLGEYWVMILRALMVIGALFGTVGTQSKKARIMGVLLVPLTLIYGLGRWWTQEGASFFGL